VSRRAPHITETIDSENLPQFTYEACRFNPLRIIVRDSEGRILPSRTVTVIRGSREALLRELRHQQRRQQC
jgi:hypothetical protein